MTKTANPISNDALGQLLTAIKVVYDSHELLSKFAPWPSKLTTQNIGPRSIPATQLVSNFDKFGTPETQPVVDTIKSFSEFAQWQQTYTEAEVGRDFLNRYGYFEVFGPTGHLHSDDLRCFVGYWGPTLDYGWHNHVAEELYFCLAGEALFLAEGEADVSLRSGDAKFHSSLQKHAMKTRDEPFLCIAFWRGKNIAQAPRMTS